MRAVRLFVVRWIGCYSRKKWVSCYSRKKEKVYEVELQGCGRHCHEPLAGASRLSLTQPLQGERTDV